jgi:hypothetical protein
MATPLGMAKEQPFALGNAITNRSLITGSSLDCPASG